jgi:hypothetical protein
MGFTCSNWTFQPNSVAWRFWLEVRIFTTNPLGTTRYDQWDPERQSTKLELGTEKINITMWLQAFSVRDGQYYLQMDLPFEIGIANPGPGLTFRQGWQYEKFDSLVYDPDFAILVTVAEPTPTSSDTPSSGSTTISTIDAIVPTWVPIVVVIAVLAVVLSGISAAVILKRRKDAQVSERLQSLNQKMDDGSRSSSPPAVSTAGHPAKSGSWQPAEMKATTIRNTQS